jgi:hypothetical protein
VVGRRDWAFYCHSKDASIHSLNLKFLMLLSLNHSRTSHRASKSLLGTAVSLPSSCHPGVRFIASKLCPIGQQLSKSIITGFLSSSDLIFRRTTRIEKPVLPDQILLSFYLASIRPGRVNTWIRLNKPVILSSMWVVNRGGF